MATIIAEKLISFKTLEQRIFQFVCMLAVEITQILLEEYDKDLMKSRDKTRYKVKDTHKTTIKTVYGSVTYNRRYYEVLDEEGSRERYTSLLDEAMKMEKIGLMSSNLAEKIAMIVTESPYRVAAETINNTCGQSISHGGVWHFIQKLGERISKEEDAAVSRMDAEKTNGEEVVPVLFEEMDGVFLKMQEGHKKAPSKEMKVATTYEGWDEELEKEKRSTLVNKKTIAGMENGKEFHRKREAQIRDHYAADEIKQRVVNGDGGSWISEPSDPDAIVQLDRFHIYQAIRRYISDGRAISEIEEKFQQEKYDEMFEFIRMYADSVATNDPADKKSKDAMKLYKYLFDNRDTLKPYHSYEGRIPEPPKGVIYKDMGVQENQNCTLITMRMKHRRMRWSETGANNMAKVLYRKENRELGETIDRYMDGLILLEHTSKVLDVLSCGRTPKRDGKGNPYVDVINHKMPILEAMQTASRRAFRRAFG